jgi:hypothetical protein
MLPEFIVACAYADGHDPMLEGSLTAEGSKLFESLDEYLLHNILHLALAPSILAGCGKDARLILDDQLLEGSSVSIEYTLYDGIFNGSIWRCFVDHSHEKMLRL